MKVLFHLAIDKDGNGKDAAFCDGNGKLWVVPYNEPTEFENEYMAEKIIEHCHYYGIVLVKQTRTKTGITYDMEDARKRARVALDVSIDACINDYVMNQMQDRVRMNFPPLPPQGRALESCIVRKYNLYRAGIRLIGWEPPYEMIDPGAGHSAIGTGSNSALEERVNQLAAQLLTQNQLLLELLTGKITGQKIKNQTNKLVKEAAPEPEPEPQGADIADGEPDSYELDQKSTSSSVRL